MTQPKTITVFTPAFNRAYCLHQVYESLVHQTNPNFCWLVIDDGSTDNTKKLVHSWINQNKIQIQYIYQKNQGMHGAHNTAYANISTELNICIDSDDYMPKDAIENLLNFWKENGNDKVAGIVGLDVTKKDNVIGCEIPKHITKSTLGALYYKHKVTGDKKLVLRTEIIKKYPKYPLFKGERFVPLGTLYMMIDRDYELLCLNKPLCVVEYLEDGSSLNMFKQYRRHPKGFRYSRKIAIIYGKYFKRKFKNAVHYVASNIQLKEGSFMIKSPNIILTTLAIPFGIFIYFYVLFKSNSK